MPSVQVAYVCCLCDWCLCERNTEVFVKPGVDPMFIDVHVFSMCNITEVLCWKAPVASFE
uniref:Uncharacterized protein n=1 Tax=Anguilla anguilla TaxID=7936 RepID=A0A0E9XK99_ANGAN